MKQIQQHPQYNLTPLLPTDNGLEEKVLGAILIDSRCYGDIAELLFEDLFYTESNRHIFIAIRSRYNANQPIDLVTVAYSLREQGVLDVIGGPFKLSQLTETVASAANIEWWVRILQQLWLKRKIIEMGARMQQQAQDDSQDIFELLSEVQVHAIQAERLLTAAAGGDRLCDTLLDLEMTFDMSDEELNEAKFPVGISSLDVLLNDVRKGELCVIAGIPGSGKTVLGINIAANLCFKFHKPVAVFSYEMTQRELLTRILADLAEVDSKLIGRKALQEDERHRLALASQKIRAQQANLIIDDRCGHMHADALRARIRSYVLQAKVELVVIDYLQLMPHTPDTKGKQTADQVGETCRKLKAIAKELDIPIILLSQLNREVMKQPHGRPRMANLRDSGGIEANADRILMVWRPDYIGYNEVPDMNGETINTTGKVCIMQVKFRHGETGEVWLRFKSQYTRFEDLDDSTYHNGEEVVNWGNLNAKFGVNLQHGNTGGADDLTHYSDAVPF